MHASKVMLKILQARLQQYVNQMFTDVYELPDVQCGFRKGRVTRNQLQTSVGSSKKQESSRNTSISVFIDYAKAFDCVDHNNLWKILNEMGKPEHLTCFLRNLYAGEEATVKTGWGWRRRKGTDPRLGRVIPRTQCRVGQSEG